MRVLIIEDDAKFAIQVRDILKDHECVIAADMHDALNALISIEMVELQAVIRPFNVVILDLKLPIKSEPGKFHDPKWILKLANEKFEGMSVVVMSNLIHDESLRKLAHGYGFTFIDKETICLIKSFAINFESAAEASQKMRSTMLEHCTSGAWTVANEPTMNLKPLKDHDEDITYMERTKARCYLLAMVVVILTPIAILAFQMYCKIALNNNDPLPYQLHIMAFCGLGIASALGIIPWVMKFFSNGVKLSVGDSESDKKKT